MIEKSQWVENLHEKVIEVKGVWMQEDSADIARNFEQGSNCHTSQETPGSISNSKIKLGDKKKRKDGKIGCVST